MHFLLFCILLIAYATLFNIAGMIIGKKFYDNVRREEHQERGKVIQKIMKTYSMIQSVTYPSLTIVVVMFIMNKNLFTLIGPESMQHGISVLRFLFTIFRGYIGFNSLIIAVARYSFIIYENQVFRVGIHRIRYFLLISTFGLPILLALLNEASVPTEDIWYCVFMPTKNETYHQFNWYEAKGIFCVESEASDMDPSLVYNFVRTHVSPSVIFAMKICCMILIIITYSNILEGLIYLHIFIYVKR